MAETIYYHSHGYEQIRLPGHHRAGKYNKLVYRHIYIYEQFHKCCVLKWGHVHHINGVKDDNRIENLQLLSKKNHNYITHFIDMSNRKCSNCGVTSVNIDKHTNRPVWHWYKGNLICGKCYNKLIYKYVKVKVDKRFGRKDISERRCSICDSNDTYTTKKGYKMWSKGNKEGEFICSRCIKSKYR